MDKIKYVHIFPKTNDLIMTHGGRIGFVEEVGYDGYLFIRNMEGKVFATSSDKLKKHYDANLCIHNNRLYHIRNRTENTLEIANDTEEKTVEIKETILCTREMIGVGDTIIMSIEETVGVIKKTVRYSGIILQIRGDIIDIYTNAKVKRNFKIEEIYKLTKESISDIATLSLQHHISKSGYWNSGDTKPYVLRDFSY